MEEFIARENIRRFQEQLDLCTDPEQRITLTKLLEAEKHQLEDAVRAKQARELAKPAA
ncbi:MAG TPA: hypothetical protein VK192_02210 [Sphingomicrobium sp.]|nr:hypothetical protein [Sphingomicrobium sp.]